MCRGFGWKWFEAFLDMMLIDRVGDFTHPISAFYDNAISHKFINDFIVNIEGQTPLIRKNPDEDFFKSALPADIGEQVINVGVPFLKKLRMRF